MENKVQEVRRVSEVMLVLKANVEKNENAVLPVNKDQPVLKVHRAN